jgi:hypothetical protein
MEVRYLTVLDKSQTTLEYLLFQFLDELSAVYEEVRLNPLNDRKELEAAINQNFEFLLNVQWRANTTPPILMIFDIQMETSVEPYRLHQVFAEPAEAYFPPLILVYNSYGRARSIHSFPRLLDLENAIRELIVTVLLEHYGSNWWDETIVCNQLDQVGRFSAKELREEETNNRLHDNFPMHLLYYLGLKSLRRIIEKVDQLAKEELRKTMPDPRNLSRSKVRERRKELISQLPFASILDNYDQVSMPAKISEIRELRNRVMHGRYLTEDNELTIELICRQFYRFLVEPGHIGNFADRELSDQ